MAANRAGVRANAQMAPFESGPPGNLSPGYYEEAFVLTSYWRAYV
jgi:hypothetical protein